MKTGSAHPRAPRITSQTRCTLGLVACEGTTYGIPCHGSSLAFSLHAWARLREAEYLDTLVPIGTAVCCVEVHGGVLMECELDGRRVFVPVEALQAVN